MVPVAVTGVVNDPEEQPSALLVRRVHRGINLSLEVAALISVDSGALDNCPYIAERQTTPDAGNC